MEEGMVCEKQKLAGIFGHLHVEAVSGSALEIASPHCAI